MMLKPIEQKNLFGLDYYFNELKYLYDNKKFPNKVLLSGQKGLGKFTLALHFINYVHSKNEEFPYDFNKFVINKDNRSFKLVLNNSSPNFYLIDVQKDKKNIEINQIRELINFCNKSSFNDKPRFIVIDNLEHMNLSSNNALLKTLEEPNPNINFILINNSQKILPTIKSRCLDFKINLSQQQCTNIFNQITGLEIDNIINRELISHYFTTGDLLNFYNFSIENNINISNIKLKDLLLKIIDENYYKKEILNINLIYTFIQMYFINNFHLENNYDLYTKFIESIGNIKKYNLEIESLFINFRHQLIND